MYLIWSFNVPEFHTQMDQLVFRLDGCTFHYAHHRFGKFGGRRFPHRVAHGCATLNEQPSNLETMDIQDKLKNIVVFQTH